MSFRHAARVASAGALGVTVLAVLAGCGSSAQAATRGNDNAAGIRAMVAQFRVAGAAGNAPAINSHYDLITCAGNLARSAALYATPALASVLYNAAANSPIAAAGSTVTVTPDGARATSINPNGTTTPFVYSNGQWMIECSNSN